MTNITSLNPTQPTFNLQAKSFFITYPQCPVSREALKEVIESKGPIDKAVIGQELHQDGNYHLHCYVKYKKELHLTHSRHFDIQGYHPNIKTARSAYASVKYCIKED